MAELLYLESSAVVKLLAEEAETSAAEVIVAGWPGRVSSVLTQLEVSRALRRRRPPPEYDDRMQEVFGSINFIHLEANLVQAAARLDPPGLRSLDAIHLATALSLGDFLGALLTYDRRLAEAAHAAGVQVLGIDF